MFGTLFILLLTQPTGSSEDFNFDIGVSAVATAAGASNVADARP